MCLLKFRNMILMSYLEQAPRVHSIASSKASFNNFVVPSEGMWERREHSHLPMFITFLRVHGLLIGHYKKSIGLLLGKIQSIQGVQLQ